MFARRRGRDVAVVAAMAILARAVILDAPPGVYWYQFFVHDTMTMSLV
jgi:hypothetical protein